MPLMTGEDGLDIITLAKSEVPMFQEEPVYKKKGWRAIYNHLESPEKHLVLTSINAYLVDDAKPVGEKGN